MIWQHLIVLSLALIASSTSFLYRPMLHIPSMYRNGNVLQSARKPVTTKPYDNTQSRSSLKRPPSKTLKATVKSQPKKSPVIDVKSNAKKPNQVKKKNAAGKVKTTPKSTTGQAKTRPIKKTPPLPPNFNNTEIPFPARLFKSIDDVDLFSVGYMRVGDLVNVRGLHGEVKFYMTSNMIDKEFLSNKTTIYVRHPKGLSLKPYLITACRQKGDDVYFIRLSGVDHIDQADLLRRHVVYVKKSDVKPLGEEEYLVRDIIGLEVYYNRSNVIDPYPFARVTDVLTPEQLCTRRALAKIMHAVIEFQRFDNGRFAMLPFVQFHVPYIHFANRSIVVSCEEGQFDLTFAKKLGRATLGQLYSDEGMRQIQYREHRKQKKLNKTSGASPSISQQRLNNRALHAKKNSQFSAVELRRAAKYKKLVDRYKISDTKSVRKKPRPLHYER